MQGLFTAFNFLLQLENERLQNTLEVYKKSLKEKSEEIESKNETDQPDDGGENEGW